MFRNRSVNVHQFSMVPRADIPRSSFVVESTHKTTFDAGYLIPFYLDEVLPGDTFNVNCTLFARLSTPLFPIMDNMRMDTFFFAVPLRLLWSNFKKFMGEQVNPGDSISYSVPQQVSPNGGYAVGSLQDYMGLPTVGQVTGGVNVSHGAFWTRAYNLIWNEWFRDENLQNSVTVDLGDGPDATPSVTYSLLRRGKRHDYFTSALPWPQKGGTSVSLPLGTAAPVLGLYTTGTGNTGALAGPQQIGGASPGVTSLASLSGMYAGSKSAIGTAAGTAFNSTNSAVIADLSAATAATINQLRQAFQVQKLLERDARGGTRYTEIVRAHFGVVSPDARQQRPEYLGGGSVPISINPIAQTGQTGLTGGSTALGTLAAMGTVVSSRNGFVYSATEHAVIIGLVSVRADLTYQQGMRKMWDRKTRYDFYFPAFAMLGEQAVKNKEIYAVGSATGGITAGDQDEAVFGYQERWSEYRHHPSMITGLFRSTSAGTIDPWHLAQKFTALPTLGSTFIQDTPPVSRIVAVGAGANGQQFIFDSFISKRMARLMPLYSVPGLIDHF